MPSLWVTHEEPQGSLAVTHIFQASSQPLHCQAHILCTHAADTRLQALAQASFGPGGHEGSSKASQNKTPTPAYTGNTLDFSLRRIGRTWIFHIHLRKTYFGHGQYLSLLVSYLRLSLGSYLSL